MEWMDYERVSFCCNLLVVKGEMWMLKGCPSSNAYCFFWDSHGCGTLLWGWNCLLRILIFPFLSCVSAGLPRLPFFPENRGRGPLEPRHRWPDHGNRLRWAPPVLLLTFVACAKNITDLAVVKDKRHSRVNYGFLKYVACVLECVSQRGSGRPRERDTYKLFIWTSLYWCSVPLHTF